ncbi:MAG: T9SS type A sorting domain-containing protein [Saprospiraceae bacterium]|nr:T9SS type A sorting domain-containing protein [Saprospiraceae bacterium]MCF8249034.1 T9SS type A sorting domain-containing protein [Saprospiraceae bacterium]MCF8282659.1 T9SS type A sorting domain-containing protein [Bacteroidales bacterium]MCF8311056.1 T9SS type A sorting domain-containing protein [Saprospiraceae bacterium]
MKINVLIFFLTLSINCCLAQGIIAGDVILSMSSASTGKYLQAYVTTLTKDIRPTIIMEWGDGTSDTISGENLHVGPFTFLNYYLGYHSYQDTGFYSFTYSDSSWISDIFNMEDSDQQPFILKAGILGSYHPSFSENISPFWGSQLDDIHVNNGVITHNLLITDFDGADSIVEKLIPVPATGYFLPDATDSLACCLTWEKPTAPGKYAFGFEAEEWGYGIKKGYVQRFITFQIDTILSNAEEITNHDSKFFIYPNPASSYFNVLFNGSYVLNSNYQMEISDVYGRIYFSKPVEIFQFGVGLTINVASYPSGIYYVILKSKSGKCWVEKLLIK